MPRLSLAFILLVRSFYAHVKSRMEAGCVSIGSHALRGVTEPVDAYQVPTPLVPHPISSPLLARASDAGEETAPRCAASP
jgi:hypothetical protein